jgi:serine protease Do
MTFAHDDNFYDGHPNPPQRPGVLAWMAGLLVVGLALLAAVTFLLPYLHKSWVESDPLFEARKEAEYTYRKREAELKAESEAMGKHLDKLQIAPTAFRAVAIKAGPSVVNVTHQFRGQRVDPRFFHQDGEFLQTSQGSGVVVRIDENKRAYVLTNSHVIQQPARNQFQQPTVAEKVYITLQSERKIEVEAKDIFQDPLTDLAVLQFDASDFPHLTVADFSDSDNIEVGDWAVAIGSPFGLKQTVTAGIISAKGRVRISSTGDGAAQGRTSPLRELDDVELIQTDAAINPGNSGGPLLDMKGRVIGINTFIITESGGNQGVGFAIPSKLALQTLEALTRPPHKIVRGFLGINMQNLTPDETQKLGLQGGVRVTGVHRNFPAFDAGLRPNDIIFRFDGQLIKDDLQFLKIVRNTAPMTTVPVDIVRGTERQSLEIKVTERPQ